MDIVQAVCNRFGIAPAFVIRRAVETQQFSNELEVMNQRIEEYEKSGTIPFYILAYCQKMLELSQLLKANQALEKARSKRNGTG